jgi:hypothetical protein
VPTFVFEFLISMSICNLVEGNIYSVNILFLLCTTGLRKSLLKLLVATTWCRVCKVTVELHCKEPIPKIRNKYSQKKKLCAHSPNFHIHVSVSDLYIPTIDLPILLQEICGPILGIYKSLTNT